MKSLLWYASLVAVVVAIPQRGGSCPCRDVICPNTGKDACECMNRAAQDCYRSWQAQRNRNCAQPTPLNCNQPQNGYTTYFSVGPSRSTITNTLPGFGWPNPVTSYSYSMVTTTITIVNPPGASPPNPSWTRQTSTPGSSPRPPIIVPGNGGGPRTTTVTLGWPRPSGPFSSSPRVPNSPAPSGPGRPTTTITLGRPPTGPPRPPVSSMPQPPPAPPFSSFAPPSYTPYSPYSPYSPSPSPRPTSSPPPAPPIDLPPPPPPPPQSTSDTPPPWNPRPSDEPWSVPPKPPVGWNPSQPQSPPGQAEPTRPPPWKPPQGPGGSWTPIAEPTLPPNPPNPPPPPPQSSNSPPPPPPPAPSTSAILGPPPALPAAPARCGPGAPQPQCAGNTYCDPQPLCSIGEDCPGVCLPIAPVRYANASQIQPWDVRREVWQNLLDDGEWVMYRYVT